jgi:hypothetical protein
MRAVARRFGARVQRTGRPRLVEKLPINAFRLPFLAAAFPGARFVLILREGTVVAESIARFAKREDWFGSGDYKWRLLTELSEAHPATQGLARQCSSDFARGLLEWRLSVERALQFVTEAPNTRVHVVRYEELIVAPVPTMEGILAFLELQPASEVFEFAAKQIGQQATSSVPSVLDDVGAAIAAPLLARLGYRPVSP